ncbi:hypothetical protein PFISCL1PPCAC_12190, partial [Pristionchus fissidentatus]
RMASSGTGAPDAINKAASDAKIIDPEQSQIGNDKVHAQTTIVVPGLDLGGSAPSSNNSSSDKENDTGSFDLLKNEEEERLIGDATPLPPIDGVWTSRSPTMARNQGKNGNSKTAPSLRSVSLPQGAGEAAANITAAHVAMTSPELGRCNSEVSPPRFRLSSMTEQPGCTLPHPEKKVTDKKAMKVVSEYYKKQNELLENFKTDNEQIQVFQKTRTRQRLASTNSADLPAEGGGAGEGAAAATAAAGAAPILQQADGEDDVSVVVSSSKGRGGGGAENGTTGGGGGGGGTGPHTAVDIDRTSLGEEDGLLGDKQLEEDEGNSHRLAASRLAKATLWINVILAIAKAIASYATGSLSIISSLVDSMVDITSGALILYSTRAIRKRDPYVYPRGRTRLEPMILVIISIVMGFASLQLLIESIKRIATGDMDVEMDLSSALIMVGTIVVKGLLVLVCKKYASDPSIRVLAQDHRNDCISNTVTLICAGMAPVGSSKRNLLGMPSVSMLDPIGAIIVSLYIMHTWWGTGKEHVLMLSGKSAKPEFHNRIIKVCIDHDPRIEAIDTVHVYHYGMKFLVEVHIVLDENMPLKVAHDISESLQINIESLPDVERAFVHTDYEYDHLPADEHKVV